MLVAFFYYSNRLFEVALISFDYLVSCLFTLFLKVLLTT